MDELNPRVGTALTGEGTVVFRDVTRFGLHRMCVECAMKYPDVEAWCEMVGAPVKLMRYTERMRGPVLFGYLWLFWKMTEPSPQPSP